MEHTEMKVDSQELERKLTLITGIGTESEIC